jgi:hypothetical protein
MKSRGNESFSLNVDFFHFSINYKTFMGLEYRGEYESAAP